LKVLFVHQNFPGQYRHIAPALAASGHEVMGLGEEPKVRRQLALAPGVRLLGYRMPEGVRPTHPDPVTHSLDQAVRRARVVAQAAAEIRRRGFVPDVMCAHIGWGEGIFLKDIFPRTPQLLFCEYFYRHEGSDFGFDPEFPTPPYGPMKLRLMNGPLLLALEASDRGVAPTRWQWQQFPAGYRERIRVVHDGIASRPTRRRASRSRAPDWCLPPAIGWSPMRPAISSRTGAFTSSCGRFPRSSGAVPRRGS
jgi:hypothetical protein